MDKKISFNIDKFNIIDEYSDSQLAVVEVYVCHDGNNLHDMPIDLSVIKAAKKTIRIVRFTALKTFKFCIHYLLKSIALHLSNY